MHFVTSALPFHLGARLWEWGSSGMETEVAEIWKTRNL